MATTLQLQTWLSEAETARHNLLTGSMVEEASSPDGTRVRYMQSDLTKLGAYIASLQAQLEAAAGRAAAPARSPVYFSFTYE